MNFKNRLRAIEKIIKTDNPLSAKDRIQVIDLSHQPWREKKEKNCYIHEEQQKRLTALRERLGDFPEDSIMWVIINPLGGYNPPEVGCNSREKTSPVKEG